MSDYLNLIDDALANLEGAWPTDDDGRLLPCGACEHAPVSEALCGASPVHVYHDGEAAFEALLDHEWQGRTERLWLGRLHVGTATTHPNGDIYVHAFNEAPTVVEHERDILPALMTQWGYTEAALA